MRNSPRPMRMGAVGTTETGREGTVETGIEGTAKTSAMGIAETGAIGVAGAATEGISTSATTLGPLKVSTKYENRHTNKRKLQQRGDTNT